MPRYSFDALDPQARALLRYKYRSWSLCVGAGATLGMLPSWRELSRNVLNAVFGATLSDDQFVGIVTRTGWQFDAWIQAALNFFVDGGGKELDFAVILERYVYQDLMKAAALESLSNDLALALHDPGLVKADVLEGIREFIDSRYQAVTVVALATGVLAAERAGFAPRAILTFNYDTILEMLLRFGEIAESRSKPSRFRRITGPAPPSPEDRIPILHLHGCLTPAVTPASARRITRRDRRERLVAPEASYLRLAGATFPWPQTAFLYYAQSDSLLLVGHSMSDPNLRRWLLWSAESRARSPYSHALPHIWIRKRPSSSEEADLVEHAVHHLGVRIAWLNEWSYVEAALHNLLGIDVPPAA